MIVPFIRGVRSPGAAGRETEKVVPIFIEGLTHKSTGVRLQAAQGLQQLGNAGAKAHKALVTALGDPEGTDVEIGGELHIAVLQSYPPIIQWTFRADNSNYSLRFNSAALMDKARELNGQSLTVIGKLGKDHQITVTGLVHKETPRILLPSFPENVPPYIFKPVITK